MDPFIANSTAEFRVCPEFANQLWAACKDVELGNDLTVAQQYETAQAFVQANNIDDGFPQVVTHRRCFDGLALPVRGGDSYVVESPTSALSAEHVTVVRAGDLETYQLQAVDIFKNPRLTGGDPWQFDILGPGPSQKYFTPEVDLRNGTYIGEYAVTLASIYPYEFILEGRFFGEYENVRLSPFQILVRPADIYGATTIVTGAVHPEPLVIGTFTNFTLKARDRFSNDLLSGGNSSFFIFRFLNSSDLSIVESTEQSFVIFDYCTGTYSVTYQLPWTPGLYYLEILANDGPDDDNRTLILKTPIVVELIPCTLNCNGNGYCNNGTCECFSGWTGPDCGTPELCIPCAIAFGPGTAGFFLFVLLEKKSLMDIMVRAWHKRGRISYLLLH